MDERTREYLAGRFRDHYRRHPPATPPAAADREWGYIPWTEGPETTMVRHRSLVELGDVGDFLVRKRPRHVYFSAGRYDAPGARTMAEKGWRGSDLVFDLDADHLPGVDPGADDYAEMLAACKEALLSLLDLLEDDFGFEDLTVVFSGGRGYHVHVRNPGVRELDGERRREIVDYVRGEVAFETLLATETVTGVGRETPAEKRTLRTGGGWGRRVHRRLRELVDELDAADPDRARQRLQSYEGIGPGRAQKVVEVLDRNADAVRAGNVDVHAAVLRLARAVAEETTGAEAAPIDEPVTTDVRRLIRLPGSLHGGSGLAVRRIDRDAVEAFDPLTDAVPGTFRDGRIRVAVSPLGGTDPGADRTVQLCGDIFTIEEGPQILPEYVGAFLMCRGRAEKLPED